MKNAVMNEVQGIQKVMEEYLGNRKAAKVAVEISVAMQGETQHTQVKEKVQAILNSYLEEDEAQECIEQLMPMADCETKATEFETIKIPGSDSLVYAELLKHKPASDEEARFLDDLRKANSKSVKGFEVFVNDPSMDNGKLQFVSGCKPAMGYAYNELEELAKENGLRLGTKDEYILFMGWLITSLINEGWYENAAWFAVCTDSKKLGHYYSSKGATGDFEVTGSRMIAGKCDLANTYKVLARDGEAGGFWRAGGWCCGNSYCYPLASLDFFHGYNFCEDFGVGWFVL